MLKKCDGNSVDRVVEYIGDERYRCFYLYADMMACGVEGPHYALWIDEDDEGKILGVAYRYFETLHLFSRAVFSTEAALSLIGELRPKCITGAQESMEPIRDALGQAYKYELSHILTTDHMLKARDNLRVTMAEESDLQQVAEMIMRDPVFTQVYTYDSIYEQMLDRFRTGKGRMFVLKDRNGKVLASSETNMEMKDFAVTGAVIADSRVRGFGFGSMLTAYMWNLLLKEGKQVYAFVAVDNQEAVAMDKTLGLDFKGLHARLLRED